MFFNNTSSWEPFLPYPDLTTLFDLRRSAATDLQNKPFKFLDELDDELARVWRVMLEFCSVINFVIDTGQHISPETFLGAMASVVYRLLDMRFEAGSSDEAVRLGLLAFSSSVFLQWGRLGKFYAHFASTFRVCLAGLTSSHVSPLLLLWLLMVGAVSVFDGTDDEWLKPLLLVNMSLCGIDSWSKLQELLKSFMWIGLVHETPGQAVFDSTLAHLDTLPL